MSDLKDVSDDEIIREVRTRDLDSMFESVVEIEIEPSYEEMNKVADLIKVGKYSEALEAVKELIYKKIGVIL